MSYFGEYDGGSASSGFIQRMMAENRVKHKGKYGPTTDLPKGSKMDAPAKFDIKKIANSKQLKRGENAKKDYGASPFLLKNFGKEESKNPLYKKSGYKLYKPPTYRTEVPESPFKLKRKPAKTGEVVKGGAGLQGGGPTYKPGVTLPHMPQEYTIQEPWAYDPDTDMLWYKDYIAGPSGTYGVQAVTAKPEYVGTKYDFVPPPPGYAVPGQKEAVVLLPGWALNIVDNKLWRDGVEMGTFADYVGQATPPPPSPPLASTPKPAPTAQTPPKSKIPTPNSSAQQPDFKPLPGPSRWSIDSNNQAHYHNTPNDDTPEGDAGWWTEHIKNNIAPFDYQWQVTRGRTKPEPPRTPVPPAGSIPDASQIKDSGNFSKTESSWTYNGNPAADDAADPYVYYNYVPVGKMSEFPTDMLNGAPPGTYDPPPKYIGWKPSPPIPPKPEESFFDRLGNVVTEIYDIVDGGYKVYSVATGLMTLAAATTPIGAAFAVFSLAGTILPGVLGITTPNKYVGFGRADVIKYHKLKGKGKDVVKPKMTEAFAKGMAFAKHYAKSMKRSE